MVKILTANAGETGSVPGLGRSICGGAGGGATMPLHHIYWPCALELRSRNYWALMLQTLKPVCHRAHALQQEKTPQWEAHIPQLECSPQLTPTREKPVQQRRPTTATNKQTNKNVLKLIKKIKLQGGKKPSQQVRNEKKLSQTGKGYL